MLGRRTRGAPGQKRLRHYVSRKPSHSDILHGARLNQIERKKYEASISALLQKMHGPSIVARAVIEQIAASSQKAL
jgi:hypothetical protein